MYSSKADLPSHPKQKKIGKCFPYNDYTEIDASFCLSKNPPRLKEIVQIEFWNGQ